MTSPTTTQANDEVREAYRQLCAALVDARVDVLQDLLDEGYTATHITGHVSPREEWLGQISSGEFTYHSITGDTTDVEVDGDRATTISTALYAVTLNGCDGHYRLRSTLTWRRHGGRWKAQRGTAAIA